MNILYIAFIDYTKMHHGPAKKVLSACRAMEKAGHSVTLLGRRGTATVQIKTDGSVIELNSHAAFPIGKLQTIVDKSAQIRDIEAFVANKRFDFCYTRYDLSTKEFIRLLKHIKEVCPKIFVEIPTYPYDKEYAGRINKLRLLHDAKWAKQLKQYVDRIVTFYPIPGDMFYEIPCLTVPNGFDFSEIELIQDDEVPQTIHIAAVSAMRHWHGYERMIEGMHQYYVAGGSRDIILHMAGKGSEEGKYRSLTQQYALEDRVIFHGPMYGEDLDGLLETCTLGLDSLGRHRTDISVLSSLKSREYGAKGIPLINSCKIDILDEDCPYLLMVPADESPVDMQRVVDFYDRVYAEGSRVAVAKQVRAYIEPRSDMSAVMGMVLAEV